MTSRLEPLTMIAALAATVALTAKSPRPLIRLADPDFDELKKAHPAVTGFPVYWRPTEDDFEVWPRPGPGYRVEMLA